jgi:hypothetical protein
MDLIMTKKPNKLIYQDNRITKFLIKSPKYGDKEVIIDTEDYDKIKNYCWCVAYDKNLNDFYVVSAIYKNKKRINLKIYRLILNINNTQIQVDHKYHNTLDNRKQNLRICTGAQNSMNRKISKNNTLGYIGIKQRKDCNRWESNISINNKKLYLGLFKNKLCAVCAYNNAALKYHGEFAYLNKI